MQIHRKLVKSFLILLSFFICLSFLNVSTYAGCADGYYCFGTTVQDYEMGCEDRGSYCVQAWRRDEFITCNASCGFTIYTQPCRLDPSDPNYCTTYDIPHSVNCCAQQTCTCGSWSGWSDCSTDCGTGTQSRSRDCNPDGCDDESDTQSCTVYSPRDGGWSAWSSCNSSGLQTRTCNSPLPYCGGDECERTDGTYTTPALRTETRPCGLITGTIWDDRNYSNDFDPVSPSEDWSRQAGCVDNNHIKTFSLRSSASDPEVILDSTAGTWGCTGDTAKYTTTQQLQRGNRVISISGGLPFSLPSDPANNLSRRNYTCSGVSWSFRNSNGASSSGDGTCTTTSIPILENDGTKYNILDWRLRPDCEVDPAYDLKVNVKLYKNDIGLEYPDPACSDPSNIESDGPNGLSVAVYPYSGSSITGLLSNGSSTFPGLSLPSFSNPSILAHGIVADGEVYEIYIQACPTYNSPSQTSLNAKFCQSLESTVGVIKDYKYGWISAIDSDIYANSVNVGVPLGIGSAPAGYVKALLNSFDDTTGGVVFAKGAISNPSEETDADDYGILNLLYEDNLGSRANGLESSVAEPSSHDSQWLNSFQFTSPSTATDLSAMISTFVSNTVYKISTDDFNSSDISSYSIDGTEGVAILFVDGDIEITNNINTSSSGRLLLIVNGSVTVDDSVGTIPSSFLINDDPNLELGIIAKDGIGFSSSDSTDDIPVMVYAPLISRSNFTFSRDLGHDTNATTPAVSAKAFYKYLYYLSSLERQKSLDNLYFTGVTIYDLDWEYIY